MGKNKNIVVLTGDLGYGLWDRIRLDYPDRFYNVGSSEQLMLGMACGLAMEGRIPVVYSITPFLLYRPFEFIRNYVDYEKIPVKLIGAGRDKDYLWLGWSHWATDDKEHLSGFKNIEKFWPEDPEDMKRLFKETMYNGKPTYVNLSR